MHRITYAGGHFTTGTEIARALVSYATALAQQGRAGAIDIPVRHEDDGQLGIVSFLVGPASQLVTEEIHVVDGEEEIRDEPLLARLRALTAELVPMRPLTERPADHDAPVDYDWMDEL
ncbi:hypothetical protein ACFWN7_14140 [Agromyces sp. NPDC058484]|uniref:hypothetical protein n=1 Tax=Agromyces sp. NPDC058484 TaxID=3346524 RepID=UPI00364F3E1C